MKKYINKIFPQNQKILNFFKIAYIFLFIINIPEIFKRVGSADLANTFWKSVALLLFILMFFLALLTIISQYLLKKENKSILISILAVQIFLYLYAAKLNSYVAGIIHPVYILPLLITFIFINRKSKNFSRNLVFFLFIPFSLIAFDNIVTLGFQITCPFTTPKAEYSPIYLSRQYFHEENINGKRILIPNIIEINGSKHYDTAKFLETDRNIVLFRNGCNLTKYKKQLMEKGNIVLCTENNVRTKRYKSTQSKLGKKIALSDITIKKLDISGTYTQIAKFYYIMNTRNYFELYFLYTDSNYCKYNNIFLSDEYFKHTSNYWERIRKNDLSYDNYIKLVK